MSPISRWFAGPVVTVIRRILAFAFVIGAIGLIAELLLLEHFDKWRQWIPLVVITVGLLVFAWLVVSRSRASLRAFQWTSGLMALTGMLGVWFHYDGNRLFELEGDPAMSGYTLLKASVMGATPMLAPGAMIQLALIGLAFAYRHPLDTPEG